jgi:hypothetical protein
MIIEAIRAQPISAFIVVVYATNILWNLWKGNWGQALYWSAALQITIAATWLTRWGYKQ